ncbi:MAG: ECF transporter S component [Ruminococcaceae bacterium]|nr:ECF transporter S component [Oscillospiraceae bacterium]
MRNDRIYKLVTASLCLALALVLPFLTGQIPEIGNMLCPMHIPVLLCGFLCGPVYGTAVGAVAPFMRSLLFGMPPLFPTAAAMCFELCVYGLIAGVLYNRFPRKVYNIYISLIAAMLCGRIVWGGVYAAFCGISGMPFGVNLFFTQAVVNAIPGIILQVILIPVLVMAIEGMRRKN